VKPSPCIVCCSVGLAISGAAGATGCSIKGVDALKEAQANGFGFEAQVNVGNGTCTFTNGRYLAIASLSEPAGSAASSTGDANLSCIGTGFVGRRISPSWKLKSMSIVGGTFAFQAPPQNGTDDLTFKFVYETSPGAPIVLGIEFLILEGTNCKDWRQAFTESKPK